LFMDASKHPLRRDDIKKNVLKEHQNVSKIIVEEAQKKFKDIFGFELIEVPKKKRGERRCVKYLCFKEYITIGSSSSIRTTTTTRIGHDDIVYHFHE